MKMIASSMESLESHSFPSLIYGVFSELPPSLNSPHVSQQWYHPIETTRPMKRQRPNRSSLAERAELNRQLKDAVEGGLPKPQCARLAIFFCA
jgi:hypothetical protein